MIKSQYKWNVKNVDQPSDEAKKLGQELELDPIICQILINRGYEDADSIQNFLNPNPDQLADPLLMHDMQRGIDRIEEAVSNSEKITVYGDYDADGVTSTAIMYEALDQLGAEVEFYIPNRFSDGYGPNVEAFKKIIENGTTLIITVDNGVSGNEAIAAANKLNCDVVVTDHHELPEQLPDAYAIIHPRFPGSNYPFGGLSGAGVAFKVVTALLQEIPQDALDLVAIGTVADLVPMTGENRVLVYYGLQAISQTARLGLSALIKEAKINPEELDEQSIGFGIAPRLNALGRLNDAAPAVELLTTVDEDRATELARDVESQNKERQELVKQISLEAEAQADTETNRNSQTLIIDGNNWHEGVLGIVASRIVEKTGKPTIVLNRDSTTGRAKGSGRSVDGFDLFSALDGHRDLMVNFGGHAMAVGMTTTIDNINQVREALEQGADKQKLSEQERSQVKVAATLNLADTTMDFFHLMKRLAPFGTDNLEPLFRFDPDSISGVKVMGADKTHLRFKLGQNGKSLDAIAFGKGSLAKDIQNGPNDTEIIGCLDLNVWKGRSTLQVMVKDVLVSGTQFFIKRTNQLNQQMFQKPGVYLFFHKKIMTQLLPFIGENAQGILFEDFSIQQVNPETVIYIVDCPDTVEDLGGILKQIKPSKIVLYLYKKQPISLLGMPERAQYAKLFKFVETHRNVDIAHQMDELAKYLEINRNVLVFMIQVFFEVGFVQVSQGLMSGAAKPSKVDLAAAPSYQLREQQIETEEKLLLSNANELKVWLQTQLV